VKSYSTVHQCLRVLKLSGLCEVACEEWHWWSCLCQYSTVILEKTATHETKNTPEICHHIYNILLLFPILCQLNPINIFTLSFLEPSVIIPSTHSQLTCSKPCISHPTYGCHMPCLSPVYISFTLI